MDEKVILYRFSRKHFVQCDMKNVFASYSKFVSESAGQMFSSIFGLGKQLGIIQGFSAKKLFFMAKSTVL